MPPVGAPDTQAAPQGPAMPISARETAAKNEAFGHYDAANQPKLEQNVPAASDQLAPAEEAIPADVMPPTPGAIKVPVAAPSSPSPVDAATAFAPKPPETATTPPAPATAEPSPMPAQNWSDSQMEAAIAQGRTDQYSELTPAALDASAKTPEGQKEIEGLSNGIEKALGDNPAAALAAAAEMARGNDKDGLKALAPALKQAIDRIVAS